MYGGLVGGISGCGKGVGIREFICVLPAGWASRRSGKPGSDRTAETYRRRTSNRESRAMLRQFPSARLHLAPVLLSLGAMIRKGVNRNGIIYVRARGFDTPSNR